MIKLNDGPAVGSYMVKRAPLFLRAVVDEETGKKDVLDQVNDTPKASEKIHVYRRIGETGVAHLLLSPRSNSGFYAWGSYAYIEEVNGEELRTTEAWRQWCLDHQGHPPTEKQLSMFPQYRPPH